MNIDNLFVHHRSKQPSIFSPAFKLPDIHATSRSLDHQRALSKIALSVGASFPSQRNRDSIYELHHQYISQSIATRDASTPNYVQLLKSNVSSNSILNLESLHLPPESPYKFDLPSHNGLVNIFEGDEEEPMQTQINPNKNRLVKRPRIVSIPMQQMVQPSTVQKSKHHIYSRLKDKNTDSTFVAVQIKPNLALLRNKGFYELEKAEDILRSSLEKGTKNAKVKHQDVRRPNNFVKVDVVKLSKILLHRSNSIVAQAQEEKPNVTTPRHSRNVSRQHEIAKLIKVIQPQREKASDEEQEHYHNQFTPINQHYFKIMKRRMKRKRSEKTKQDESNEKQRTRSIDSHHS